MEGEEQYEIGEECMHPRYFISMNEDGSLICMGCKKEWVEK